MTGPSVSRRVERAVAEVLGATPAQATAVVDQLADAGLLAHGVVVMAAVAAARWGIELPDAVVAMAEGRAVPEGLSDYELRTAAEEGEADVEALWQDVRARGTGGRGAWDQIGAMGDILTEGDQGRGAGDGVSASRYWIDPVAVMRG